MTHLIHKLLHTIQRQSLIPPDSRLVVAVSGGADSMALLHMLHQLQTRLECTLHVATLDHGLRGEESAADAEFVRQTAETWGVPVTVGKADLDPHAPGVEARARQVRYAFLTQTAHSVGAERIAVAHHADDQAETVLMHIIRGGGIHGLSGMAYSSQLSAFSDQPLTLIRPMLDITRAEIEAYCAEQGIAYRHDKTNDHPHTLRNRLRLETLPHLRTLNPQIVPALNRLAQIASAEDDYLEGEAARFIVEYGKHDHQDRTALYRDAFRALHRALQRRVIARIADEPDFDHVDAAVDLMQTAGVGAVALLPNLWQVRMGYDEFYVEQRDAPETFEGYLLPAGFEIAVNLPGVTITPQGWRLTLQLTIEEATLSDNDLTLTIPLNASVMLRTRRAGDRLAPKGLDGHTRKLKDWMIDRKIPQRLRDQLPLLTVNGEIAAVLSQTEWHITEPFIPGYNPVTLHNRYIYVTVAKI